MTTTGRRTAVGVFTEQGLADRAIEQLHQAGFTDDQLGFVTRGGDVVRADDPALAEPVAEGEHHSNVPSAATGAVGGGIIGGVLGAAASLLIPGFGPALAGGILAATLGGAAIGAVAGGFTGSLVDFGVPEEEARYYQEQLTLGRTIVTVTNTDRFDEATAILRACGATDAEVRDDMPRVDAENAAAYNADRNPTGFPPVMLPGGVAGAPGGTFAGGMGTAVPGGAIAPVGLGAWVPPTAADELNDRSMAPAENTDVEQYDTKGGLVTTPTLPSDESRTELRATAPENTRAEDSASTYNATPVPDRADVVDTDTTTPVTNESTTRATSYPPASATDTTTPVTPESDTRNSL